MRSTQWLIAGAVLLCAQPVMAGPHAVLELFTSQGCSSCPPADALAGQLSSNPAVLVLSFHVTYWDGPLWRDPFSSQASTDRQNAYAHVLRVPSVFTPQLIVNGTQSLVGSQEDAVTQAVAAATQLTFPVQVDLSRQGDGSFALDLHGIASGAQVWEVRYVRHAVTRIRGGENGGLTLQTDNNVTDIRRLRAVADRVQRLPSLRAPEDGLAVIVQARGLGKMLGASMYPAAQGT